MIFRKIIRKSYLVFFLKKVNISKVTIQDDKEYKILGVRSYGKGAYVNRTVNGSTLKMREYQQAKINHLFWCKVDTKNGAFGIITDELADGIASSNMTFAEIDTSLMKIDFLQLLFTSKGVMQYLDSFVTGSTNRKYIRPEQLLNEIEIPLPSISEQERIVNSFNTKKEKAKQKLHAVEVTEAEIESFLFKKLGLEKVYNKKIKKGLQLFSFTSIVEWGIDKIKVQEKNSTSPFKICPIIDFTIDVFRGKSPQYKNNTNAYMLNQKCNRWNSVDLSFAKTVDENWLKSIDDKFLTKEGDILINSTGEGTIGRASYITSQLEGLLYDSHLLLLRIDRKQMNPELFVELFNSSFGQEQVNEIKSAQATKQTELGVANLMKIKMPIPDSLELQNEIIEHIKNQRVIALSNKEKAILLLADSEKEFENEIFGK